MRVVGRSGVVMNLPDSIARGLLRSGSVTEAEAPSATPASVEQPPAEPEVSTPTPDNATVRRWAAQVGLDCPARGKIPNAVMDAYWRAHAPDWVQDTS